jgi:hypothetical protein
MNKTLCILSPLGLTAILGLAMTAHAAASLTIPGDKPAATGNTPTAATAKPSAADARSTNVVTIPVSTFNIPHNQSEGRDPFFPTSMRPYMTGSPVAATNIQPLTIVELRLNGVSGSPEHRLAIINNHTFESGEEADVTSGRGKVRVRCIEIKNDSVIVQFGNERRELHLRPGL